MSLFSRKAYDKLTAMTKKKVGYPCSLVSYSHFSTHRAHQQGKSAMFFNARVHECAPGSFRFDYEYEIEYEYDFRFSNQ